MRDNEYFNPDILYIFAYYIHTGDFCAFEFSTSVRNFTNSSAAS